MSVGSIGETEGAGSARKPTSMAGFASVLLILALSVAVQTHLPMPSENAWFLTFAEKVLDGARPYIDISDPNLPAAWLLYMPAAILSRLTGAPAEALVTLEAICAILLCMGMAGRTLSRAGLLPASQTGVILTVAAFMLLFAQAAMFGQREHFAVAFTLPILAVYAARAGSRDVALSSALFAGALAAATMAIKPHFAAVFGLAALWTAFRGRSLALLLRPETLAAAGLTIVAYLAIAWFTPAYYTVTLPDVALAYARCRYTLGQLLAYPATLPALAAVAAVAITAAKVADPRAGVAGFAALGFVIVYFVQGKPSPYYILPAVDLAAIALACQFARARDAGGSLANAIASRALAPVLAITPVLGGVYVALLPASAAEDPAATLARFAPGHPTVGAITENGAVGFPMIRQAGGVWICRHNAL